MTYTGGRESRSPRSLFSLILLGTAAALVCAVLVALGNWQLRRLAWKHDLIAQVSQKIHSAPAEAPAHQQWGAIVPSRDAYRRIRMRGVYLNDRETLVQAVTERGGGYWVMTPLRTEQGFIVLVNRGFVPPETRNPRQRMAGQIEGPVVVTGLLRITEPAGGFLHTNDPGAGRWYSRDVAAIAAARGLKDVAPYFIDADAASTVAVPGAPVGGLTVVRFANNHLVYAITWYSLALMVAGAGIFVIGSEWRIRCTILRLCSEDMNI